MRRVRLMVTRHAAFYAPVLCAISGGFLRDKGLDPEYQVGSPAKATRGLLDGSVDVAQSAVSASWPDLESGTDAGMLHFAEINRRDGFFLIARWPTESFSWSDLAGRPVLVDHGRQPIAMFKHAAAKMGLDYAAIEAVDAGQPDGIEAAFRAGEAEFAHLQGPVPQQLEAEGIGQIVASLGEVTGPVSFSSLRASRSWLEGETAVAFMRGYREARKWVESSPACDVASILSEIFPSTPRSVLESTVGDYQRIGTWSGDAGIDLTCYEAALDIFLHVGDITRRHPYEAVAVPPPDEIR